jgi:hypothetical protein
VETSGGNDTIRPAPSYSERLRAMTLRWIYRALFNRSALETALIPFPPTGSQS